MSDFTSKPAIGSEPGAPGIMPAEAAEICSRFVPHPSWAGVTEADVTVDTITGGLTNKLYKVTNDRDGAEPRELLIRRYQMDLDDVSTREQEVVVFALLAERGVAPALHGLMPGGRVEGWVADSRPLKTAELAEPAVVAAVASQLAKLHNQKMPIECTGQWLPGLLQRWAAKARSIEPDSSSKREVLARINARYDITAAIEWMIAALEARQLELVFCHNDSQEGNILKKADGTLALIDFEYAAYNFAAFDVANYFCEWTFGYDHPSYPFFWADGAKFPSAEAQRRFIAEYLAARGKPADAAAVDRFADDVRWCSPAPDLMWALWGIVNANCPIEFGYLEFAEARLIEFERLKALCV